MNQEKSRTPRSAFRHAASALRAVLTLLLVLLATASSTIAAQAVTKEITYLNYVGGASVFEEAKATATQITSESDNLSGWYYVEGDVTIDRNLYLSGDTHLILCDGATLEITREHRINISDKNLTIYAQSSLSGGSLKMNGERCFIDGSGNVTINGGYIIGAIECYIRCGKFTVNEGNVTVYALSSYESLSAINASAGVAINGGKVFVYYIGNYGYDIESSDVTINGGELYCQGRGIKASGSIKLGWSNYYDCIQSTSYEGTISTISGKGFEIDGGGTLDGGVSVDGNSIAGQELTPKTDAPIYNVFLAKGLDNYDYVYSSIGGAPSGMRVPIDVTPPAGKTLASLSCSDGTNDIPITRQANDYVFYMPAADVTISATFAPCAQIGDTQYATLADALAAVTNNGTITIIGGFGESTLTSTVPDGKSVTIDLNGKTVSVDKIVTSADLTLKNGTLVCNTLSNTNTNGENTLTIDKATVTVNTNLAWNANNIILQNAAKVTVKTAMTLGGSTDDGNNGADFTITDGSSTFTLVKCTVNGSNPDRVAAKMSPYVQPGHESEFVVDGTTKNSMTLKIWGVSLASGLGEKAKVEFYDGGETAPDATTFDPSAYKPFGEEGANEIKVYDNSAGADRYIIVHVVPTGFEYWTDASLLSMQETGASVTGTASALTLLKRDTYDSDSKTYTRYDGAGWYCYKLPGEHTVAAGYSNSTLGGDVVKTFNLDPANSAEGTFTQNGNEVILTNGEGWQASLTYDQISWTFDGQSHHPATTTITVTKGDKTLKLTSATDIAQQIVDGEEYNPAAIATHFIKVGAKPYSWFKQSQYNIATFSITVPFPGKGTETEPWLVQGAKNLVLLAQCVNTGCYSFDKEYVKLDNGEGYSYDMSAEAGFEPIGLIDDEHFTPFCGIFDGNGVTISGINYTYSSNPSVVGDAGRYCIGLFGQLGNSADDPEKRKEGAVKNLTLSNCTFASTSNQVCYVGGVVGYIDNGSLTDVSVSGCNISATKDGSRVGAIASGVNTATLTRNYYKYDTKVTLGKAVATDYAKRGIGTATGGDDVATNDGAMLWVKKASLGDITKPTGSGGTVAFAENTPGVNCYAVDGDDILYAVGKSVSLSVSPGTSTDGIRTFGDELAALTMNDGTSNTDIKDARAFTMPKTDVTISGTLSLSDWFTIQTNGNRWMSFYQEWGNYAVSGVSSGASGTRRGGLLIELLTIGSIDFDAGVATLADLGGSSFKGVPMFFHCEDGLPEQLRFDPVEGKTAPEHDGQFKGGVSDLSAFAGQSVFVLFGSELARVDLSGSTAFDPNKAFVAASTKSATRLTLVRDGATAIDLVTTSDEGEGKWFDLQGRQLDGKPSKKGLYIRNGKKMIIK